MSEQCVKTEITDGIATVTMNRPDVHNAFDENMIGQLTDAFAHMGGDDDLRAVILRGSGKSFCAGGDLNWMRKTAEYDFDKNFADALELGWLLKTINTLNKPVIGLIHGNAFGGGVGLTACCDIVIAEEDTKFCLSEVRIGLIPSIIAPYVLTAMGERQARRYFLTAERFDGAKAKELGLVHEVVAKGGLDQKCDEIIASLKGGAPKAQAMGKALIQEIGQREIDDKVIKYTAKKIAEARANDEGKHGLSAFLDKTEPRWRA